MEFAQANGEFSLEADCLLYIRNHLSDIHMLPAFRSLPRPVLLQIMDTLADPTSVEERAEAGRKAADAVELWDDDMEVSKWHLERVCCVCEQI